MTRGFLSSRAVWDAAINRLTIARNDRVAASQPLLDLTESNPTRAGFVYGQELRDGLGRAAGAPYTPDPRGLLSAREALSHSFAAAGDNVHPDDIFLTASTSEAYGFLFKLLANQGESILTATPSYPLLEYISVLELLRLETFPMSLRSGAKRWEVDIDALRSHLAPDTRAIVVVHPNNPTGNYLSATEQLAIIGEAARRRTAVISDEVFFDFPLRTVVDRAPAAASSEEGLTFSLGGLSKSAALPHWKLGWIRVGGERQVRREAAAALELIGDTYLSAATPVQVALPEILAAAPGMRARILARLERNLAVAREIITRAPALELLEPEGGWSLVLRLPRVMDDEQLCIELLEETGVVVQPGYFFDFAVEGFIVVSLLTEESVFAEGLQRFRTFVTDRLR